MIKKYFKEWELNRVLAPFCRFVCSVSVNWTEHWWHSKCFAALHSWWSWWCFEKDTGKTFANSHDQGQIFKFWRYQNDFLTSCLSYLKYFYVFTFYAKHYSQLLKNISHFKFKLKQVIQKLKASSSAALIFFFFFFCIYFLFTLAQNLVRLVLK